MSSIYENYPYDISRVFDPINMSIIILGLILNIFLGIINFRRWRSFSNDLVIIQLASYSDIVFCSSLLAVQILKLTRGPTILLEHETVCQATGMIVLATACISLTCVTIIGMLRYFAIVKGIYYKTKLWSFVVLGVVCVWFLIAGLAFYSNLYGMMPSGTYCFISVNTTKMGGKLLGIFVVCYLIFIDLIFVLNYIMITNQYLLYSDHLMNNSPELSLSTQKKKIKLRMILLILAYQVVLLPSILVGLIGIFYGGIRTPLIDGLTSSCIKLVTVVNPICIMTLHDDTKRELRQTFNRNSNTLFIINDDSMNSTKYELYPIT
ncbi:hypothetical protein CONCODRAFT_78113 [Conidiobolus coronatus NRRL 28638]|uniref:G-protein coupled receptors family 1 profile domain-containing protein n=1 Tax=Conidiobolus coronatus (strain ATCC 28846 / CBS 209.66 / NRRL 28638) TaxID=796925 RepID=A0A137PAB4_CONC2|nr:hypothetical protein CONCODRAFT_78113 [Conidiobolus coronatus NRRL 28638]|eukprot:KXN71871.1 hypothetical protein CONCODRAFT_78113 [Conidiobolus coronatus NRRL 28638]